MTPAANRPDLIEDMLAALREDGPTYTDEELDAGFNAVLTDLTDERAREAEDLAVEAELGSDAYALGLEYLERGDLERAARYLRIAVSHGVPAAQQHLQDARELHRTVDSLIPNVAPPRAFDEQASVCQDESAKPGWTRRQPFLWEARLRELAPERCLQDARKEAERILDDARRTAAKITKHAQHAARPQEPASLEQPADSSRHKLLLWPRLNTHATPGLPTFLVHPDTQFLSHGVDHDNVPLLMGSCRDAEQWHNRTPCWPQAQHLVYLNACHTGRPAAHSRGPGHTWPTAGQRRTLRDLIGREATEAYEQASQGGDADCLRLHLAADPHLMPRLLDWAQTVSPATTAGVRRSLTRTWPASTADSGLVLPLGTLHTEARLPVTAMA